MVHLVLWAIPKRGAWHWVYPCLGWFVYYQDGFWQWVYHITAAIICYLMAIKCQGTGHVMMHQLPRLPWMLAYTLHPQRAGMAVQMCPLKDWHWPQTVKHVPMFFPSPIPPFFSNSTITYHCFCPMRQMPWAIQVCFANLATLHAYLHEKEQALKCAKPPSRQATKLPGVDGPEVELTGGFKSWSQQVVTHLCLDCNPIHIYTLWWTNIAIENGHRNSGFSHEKWWIFPLLCKSSPEGRHIILIGGCIKASTTFGWDEDPVNPRYIAKALEVEPTNPTYLALRQIPAPRSRGLSLMIIVSYIIYIYYIILYYVIFCYVILYYTMLCYILYDILYIIWCVICYIIYYILFYFILYIIYYIMYYMLYFILFYIVLIYIYVYILR